jgi:hypothetical protein
MADSNRAARTRDHQRSTIAFLAILMSHPIGLPAWGLQSAALDRYLTTASTD